MCHVAHLCTILVLVNSSIMKNKSLKIRAYNRDLKENIGEEQINSDGRFHYNYKSNAYFLLVDS